MVEEESGVVVGADWTVTSLRLTRHRCRELWTVELPGPVVGAPTIAETDQGRSPYVATADRRQSRLYQAEPGEWRNLAPPVDVEVESLALPVHSDGYISPLDADPHVSGYL